FLQGAQRDEPIEALFCHGMPVVSSRSVRQQINGSATVTDKTIQVHPTCQATWDAIGDPGDDLSTVAVTDHGHVAEIVRLNVADDVFNAGVEPNRWRPQVRLIRESSQRWCVDFMTGSPQ